jgi:hypothetical protein
MSNQESNQNLGAAASSGSSASIAQSGNVTQHVSLEAAKPSRFATVFIPLLAAVLGAVTSAYATNWRAQANAADLTINGTETLLGITKSALDIARSSQASPALLERLETLASQAQAVQASAQSLRSPPGAASLQADFWLRVGQGAQLPSGSSVGVREVYDQGDILVSFGSGTKRLSGGEKAQYNGDDEKLCNLLYMGPSPDQKLHGFKTWCDA